MDREDVASTFGRRAAALPEGYRRLAESEVPGLAEGARAGMAGLNVLAGGIQQMAKELRGMPEPVAVEVKKELVPYVDAGLRALEVHKAMLDTYQFATKHQAFQTTGSWWNPFTWGDDPATPQSENPVAAAYDTAARTANAAGDFAESASKAASLMVYGGVALLLWHGYNRVKKSGK